jgi:uncharacterized membrane protein
MIQVKDHPTPTEIRIGLNVPLLSGLIAIPPPHIWKMVATKWPIWQHFRKTRLDGVSTVS